MRSKYSFQKDGPSTSGSKSKGKIELVETIVGNSSRKGHIRPMNVEKRH